MKKISIYVGLAVWLAVGLCDGAWLKIDDFQGYPKAALPKNANDWQIGEAEFTRVEICADDLAPGNQAAKLIHKQAPKSHHDVLYHTGALNIPPGQTGTIFLRFMIESGLDELGHTRGEKPVEAVQMAISVTESTLLPWTQRAGLAIEGKDVSIVGTARTRTKAQAAMPAVKLKRNQWYRLWLVIHNAPGSEDNKSKAFIQEEGSGGKLVEIPGLIVPEKDYRPAIWKTLGFIKAPNSGLTDVLLDDFYVDNTGENLACPASTSDTQLWREKLNAEAKKYAHLLKKAATWELAEKQARELVAAMTPDERFELVRGSLEGIPGFLRLGIPTVRVNDASSGINNDGAPNRARLPRTVAYPCTLLLAATWNLQAGEAYGRSIGEECRNGGTSILLGPSVNFYRSSVGGRNFEYLGEDPLLTSRQIAAYVRGLRATDTAATLKVFIGNEYEFRRRGSNSIIDERALHEVYMEPFRLGIDAGALCVMSAYNQLNGEWTGQSKYANTDLLRGDLGFKGIIMTDWIATSDGVKFVESGANLDMPFGTCLTMDRDKVFGTPGIDRMVATVLATCIQAGFYDRPDRLPELEAHRPQWEKVARDTNLDGITLLKNNGLLPLAGKYDGKKILVLGNRAATEELSGNGSGHVPGYNNKTYIQAITETFPGAAVTNPKQPEKLTDEEIRAADLVLVFPGLAEGEGRDREFVLPEDKLISRCVAINPRTVVCLVTGGGVAMDWADQSAAIVYAYYGGQTGASALMDILTGRAEPSGRLPFTIERRVEDAPGGDMKAVEVPDLSRPYPLKRMPIPGELFPNADKTQGYVWNNDYKEGVFVGHRWYESRNIPVRFPFGFGLGYTTFAYENLKIEVNGQSAKVRFLLKNTGQRPGAEVAQVYVSEKVCSAPRPPQELKGFQKVCLEAGQSKDVEIELAPEAFRYWNPTTKQWTIEPGEFEIRVGASSADIRLKETIAINSRKEEGK